MVILPSQGGKKKGRLFYFTCIYWDKEKLFRWRYARPRLHNKVSVETLQQQESAHDVPPVGMQRLQQKDRALRPDAAQFL